jgi:hypothetical protein
MVFVSVALAASVEVKPGDDIRSLTASLTPGTEIVFHGGTYSIDGPMDLTGTGTADEPIVLRAAEGETPVIELTDGWVVARFHDGGFARIAGITFQGAQAYIDASGSFGGVDLSDVTDVTIEDCVIRNITGTGLSLDGDNRNLVIRHNEIANIAQGNGIAVGCYDASCWTQDSVIDGNWVHGVMREDGATLAYFNPGTQNVTFTNNVLHTSTGRGLQFESTESGPQNIVEGNAIWGVVDAGIYMRGAAIVRNNVVFDVTGRGMRLNASDRVLEKLVVSHNTVVRTTDWGVEISGWAGAPDMVFANNAITNTTGYGIHVDDGGVDANNYLSTNLVSGLVEGLVDYPDAVIPGAGAADYADFANNDFYPGDASSILDGGDAASGAWIPPTDFNGSNRDGVAPDIGAYELVASENPGWKIQEGFKALVADPNGEGQNLGGCCKKDADPTAALVFLPLIGWLRRRRTGAVGVGHDSSTGGGLAHPRV